MTSKIQIIQIMHSKRRYLDLLLIGDEQESMIEKYLDRGDLYVGIISGKPIGVCVVTKESETLIEIKNIAVLPDYRRKGIGHEILKFIEQRYKGCNIQLCTGETPSTLNFYYSAGYKYSHRIKGFFTKNYDHPIIEEDILLKDMLYLIKKNI